MKPEQPSMIPPPQHIKVAVDNCIFTVQGGHLHVLLIQVKKKPFAGMWALPGGLVADGEILDDAAARILEEETGVSDVYLEQLYTFGSLDRDPSGRVVSVAYLSLINGAAVTLRPFPKYAAVRWWKYAALPDLVYDHKGIAAYAKKRLAWKLEYTNVAWSLLPPQFTLSDLQQAYEAVLGRDLDKRNFRKKILSLGLLKPVGEKTDRGAHRPPMLYSFTTRKPKIVQVL
jgi:8-oxo-dGTP diphosphatase